MRRKFAAAQSGLRRGKEGTFSFSPFQREKENVPFSLQTYRGLHSAPPILSLNQ
jgi:hypothetical protein